MARIEKTVFISYRRTDVYTALAVYENLKNQGYDVFFDYRSISSGDFEQIITSNIRARAHFLLILTPTALDRCNEPGDWLRREIEFAIDDRRNIIPLFFRGFRFGDPSVTAKLTGKLLNVSRYNGLNVHEDYFDEAMQRLRTQYLNIPLNTVLHPVSTEVRKVVRAEQIAADEALEHIENVKELARQDHEEPVQPKAEPTPRRNRSTPSIVGVVPGREKTADNPVVPASKVASKPKRVIQNKITVPRTTEGPINGSGLNIRSIGWIIGGVSLLALLIWGGVNIFQNRSSNTPEPTLNSQVAETQTSRPLATNTSPPVRTSTPTEIIVPSSTPTFEIISTMEGNDGMTLLYVPASEFTMGSDNGGSDERPVHRVYLDAFWIDKTEVTNKMYGACFAAGICKEPTSLNSNWQRPYFGNPDFDNYPVIHVDWESANTYCEWAKRRLPSEAEWEKSARGTDAYSYPWGNSSPDVNDLNYNRPGGDTRKVGNYFYDTSPYGAVDMAGNVFEWVADWWDPDYYKNSPSSNPLGPDSGDTHVYRGGSWYFGEDYAFSYSRHVSNPTYGSHDLGFRCAMSASP